jgi:hypothetical protein
MHLEQIISQIYRNPQLGYTLVCSSMFVRINYLRILRRHMRHMQYYEDLQPVANSEPQSRTNDEVTDLNAPVRLKIDHPTHSIIMKVCGSAVPGVLGGLGMWRLR